MQNSCFKIWKKKYLPFSKVFNSYLLTTFAWRLLFVMGKIQTLQPHKHYGNILVISPDGTPMYRCSIKKAKWHLDRNLAVWNSPNLENRVLRLTFKPNGLGHCSEPELLEEQLNICCVCGSEKNLVKNHIVPREFLHHFPIEFKTRKFENKIMLCVECLKKRDIEVKNSLLKILSDLLKVPFPGVNLAIDKNLQQVQFALLSLRQKKNTLPESVKQAKQKVVFEYFGREPSEEEIKEVLNKRIHDKSNYKSYGQMIVEKIVDFEMFIDVWRNHFMQTMKPKFPPSHLKRNENQDVL